MPVATRVSGNLRPHRFLHSALTERGAFLSTEGVLEWLASRAACKRLLVERVGFSALRQWSFEEATGDLVHQSGKFFRVQGARVRTTLGAVQEWDQPIIDQPEIGILGIVAREFDGVLHFLMQAKMEPGNVDGVQLTPTVQATRSNYTQVHQGARPPYVDYFLDRTQSRVLVDQLQFEQGSAFLRKRNRNIIVEVSDNIPVGDEHQWMTLGQVQRLLRVPHLISMDARTVLSCIPLLDATALARKNGRISDRSWRSEGGDTGPGKFGQALLDSLSENGTATHRDELVMSWLTDLKCRHALSVERITMHELQGWTRGPERIHHDDGSYFHVIGVRVEADNREVASWDQPLVEPIEPGLIAFLVKEIDGVLHFLVQGKIEPGNLDVVAVAPTVQSVLSAERVGDASSWPPFLERVLLADPSEIRYSCAQSEEGGRFYRVVNEYRVVELPSNEEPELPENYLWASLRQLNELLRHGLVNVEARGLLACLPLTDER